MRVRPLALFRMILAITFVLALGQPAAAKPPQKAPKIQGPAGTASSGVPRFKWSAVSGADSYKIWINRGSDVFYKVWVDTSSYQPEFELPAGKYTWWVRAANQDGKGPWSEPVKVSFRSRGGEGDPLEDLTSAQLKSFKNGKRQFSRTWLYREGLGPLFNASKCSFCHGEIAVGGGGRRYRSNFVFGRLADDGSFDPLTQFGGPLFHERVSELGGVPQQAPQQVPEQANVFSHRLPGQLFGLGLVEAIPDQMLLALADPDDSDGDGISGRAPLDANGRVMRFGSQSHEGSLHAFVAGAFQHEMGIEDHELPPGTVEDVTNFVRFLRPISAGEEVFGFEAQKGKELFEEIGCGDCHTPKFEIPAGSYTTLDGEVVNVAAMQNTIIYPYSDFLLHDMGNELDDGVTRGTAETYEYRTPPLWGMRFRRNRLMHDGRGFTVRQAVLLHGGEASAHREAFLALSFRDKNRLEAFVGSL